MGGLSLLLALVPSLGLLFIAANSVWLAFCCYYLTPSRIKKALAKQGVFGPEPKLLTGNLLDVAALVRKTTSSDMPSIDHDIVGRLMPHYLHWTKIYGKRFVYWYGSEPRLCLTETDLIKELLSSKYVQVTGKSWLQRQGAKNFIGEGLLFANGGNWFHQRRGVAPAFMGEQLKGHYGYMVECTKQVLRSLHARIRSDRNSYEVEIGEYMTKLTAEIISRTVFDSSYEQGKKIFHPLNKLQQFTAVSSRYLWIPGGRFLPNKFRREIKALKAEVDRRLAEIIQSKIDGVEIGRSSTYGRGLLGTLLAESQKKSDQQGFKYNLQLVMDECKTVYFAGQDTSSLLLTWAVMLLATNTSWQERAREEVMQVCGDQPPSVDQLCRLTLLHMIINETLRLYPPASLLPRMAFEDIKLGDLHIPKGTSIWIPVLAIQHDKKIWGEDANEFNPERFSGRSFSQTGRHFLPFAAGPRNCVGQAFAMMESKIILAMMLSHFKFTISENYRHAPVNVLTLQPKYGVQVYVDPLRPPPPT